MTLIPTRRPALGHPKMLIIKLVPIPSLMIYINWDMGCLIEKPFSMRLNG